MIMVREQPTSSDWLHEASRCYVEGHQACAWCGVAHVVHRNVDFGRVEYQCNNCDFHVSRDTKTDQIVMVPGEKSCASTGQKTMHDIIVH
jgi:hypothetical protein